jgi:hypothetical protein
MLKKYSTGRPYTGRTKGIGVCMRPKLILKIEREVSLSFPKISVSAYISNVIENHFRELENKRLKTAIKKRGIK